MNTTTVQHTSVVLLLDMVYCKWPPRLNKVKGILPINVQTGPAIYLVIPYKTENSITPSLHCILVHTAFLSDWYSLLRDMIYPIGMEQCRFTSVWYIILPLPLQSTDYINNNEYKAFTRPVNINSQTFGPVCSTLPCRSIIGYQFPPQVAILPLLINGMHKCSLASHASSAIHVS